MLKGLMVVSKVKITAESQSGLGALKIYLALRNRQEDYFNVKWFVFRVKDLNYVGYKFIWKLRVWKIQDGCQNGCQDGY